MPISHSVKLDKEKCIGCTDCIKRCPTEAIRVRGSKALITDAKCIDCGMCIRTCRNGAKKAVTDPMDTIHQYRYKVAIPAPTLYTQFKGVINPNMILTGLKKIGFDDVFEVSKGAEIVSAYTQKQFESNRLRKPVISSACPAIVKLIQIRFPSLIPNILPVISPMEAMARYTKKYLTDQGIPEEDIGIFFITPCAAKVTNNKNPEEIKDSHVNGVISMRDVYRLLVPVVKQISEPEPLMISKIDGIAWCNIGGEGKATHIENHIAVDGIENVIRVLERIEDGKLDIDFVECLACVNGCLGGPLTVEDSFVASNRMDKIMKYIKEHPQERDITFTQGNIKLSWDYALRTKQVMKLDDDMEKALEKAEHIEEIYESLPQIDCGSCGAPTCRALAEDIVQEQANIEDCIFMLREKVRSMAEDMLTLARKIPPSINKNN